MNIREKLSARSSRARRLSIQSTVKTVPPALAWIFISFYSARNLRSAEERVKSWGLCRQRPELLASRGRCRRHTGWPY